LSKWVACVEYAGHPFCGWQRQTHSPSVQQCVEDGLSRVADHSIEVQCAGRTDTGVHATNQIIHFDSLAKRPSHAWVRGANTFLPEDIRIKWCQPVLDDFHARFSAQSRTYRYIVLNTPTKSALAYHYVTWHSSPLCEQTMGKALELLAGENDFSAFQAASCQSNTPMRNVIQTTVWRIQHHVIIEIEANAFLHHMVRNIVGSVLRVGDGRWALDTFRNVFNSRDRTKAAETAPPNGLYLVEVKYPALFKLPAIERGPGIFSQH